MKPMKAKELEKLLFEMGFKLKKQSKHIIYDKDGTHVAVPRSKTIAPGTLRNILKIARSLA